MCRVFEVSALAALFLLAATTMVNAQSTSSSTKVSLDQPFQSSFKNLKHSPCVTLYTRSGREGCGTVERDVQSAPVYYYDGKSQLNPGSAFTAVIEEFQMTAELINNLVTSNVNGDLKGILVLNSTDSENTDDYYSPGPMYPLGYGTLSASLSYGDIQFPWNGNGDGLIQVDLFGIPMAYVNEWEASNYLRDVAKDSSRAAKIVASFNYYMGPDGITSADCLAWRDVGDSKWNPKCAPLGGLSVWGHAGSPPPVLNNVQYVNNNNNENEEEAENEAEGEGGARRLQNDGNDSNVRPAIVVGGSIDATSMFHDLAPGANTAASNILALMMAAYLIGENVNDFTLDALPRRIVFGFFQGEAYGYLGSRTFFRDVLGFRCYSGKVNSVSHDEKSDLACLNPLRPSLKFSDLGSIAGMLAVDQVGIPLSDGVLYVHNDGSGGMGTFMANVLKTQGTQYYNVASSAAGENSNQENGFPMPPTPLQSLQSLTGGAIGGAVLSGYDYVFAKRPPYQSQLNSVLNKKMNYKSIAASATLLARTALAAAYDAGDYDYQEAADYAYKMIPELSYNNDVLVELGDCLFTNGNCKMLYKYANMEALNERDYTGFGIGTGISLGTPPSYYVSIYNMYYGQPFVQVNGKVYGGYNGDKYGKKKSDAIGMQPRMLEQALRNMLHDFLGRGSVVDENGGRLQKQSCKKRSDCSSVQYCNADGDFATCSGQNECVCSRGYFHIAKDEAIEPALNNATGFFVPSVSDAGISPLYTEPYWDSSVGVKVYRDTDTTPGFVTLGAGFATVILCFFVTVIVKVSMKKAKVY
jgi:nicastrin